MTERGLFGDVDATKQAKSEFPLWGKDGEEWVGKWESSHLLLKRRGVKGERWLAVAETSVESGCVLVIDRENNWTRFADMGAAHLAILAGVRKNLGLRTSKFEAYIGKEKTE